MNTRRAAHAAGPSWRKWQDPVVAAPSFPRVALFWSYCAFIGLWVGTIVASLKGWL